VLTTGRVIEKVDLPDAIPPARADEKSASSDLPLREWLNEQEKRYLLQQLESSGGKISLAARSCGVDVKTLYRKMRLHGLDKKVFQPRASKDLLSVGKNLLDEKTPSSLRPRDS
jgi:DNA-binding NtrC family response regulator